MKHFKSKSNFRKGGLLLNNVVGIIGATAMGCSKYLESYELLIMGRFLIGVNCGKNGFRILTVSKFVSENLKKIIITCFAIFQASKYYSMLLLLLMSFLQQLLFLQYLRQTRQPITVWMCSHMVVLYSHFEFERTSLVFHWNLTTFIDVYRRLSTFIDV